MKDAYFELKKKYSLPDFAVIESEFELARIEDNLYVLRDIRHRIDDKLSGCIKLFSDLFHPDAGFVSFREANVFSESDRAAILKIYSKLMYFHRLSTELDIDDSDELNAKFIRDLIKEWPELKKAMVVFVKRMKDSWLKDVSKKDVVGYFG